METDKQRSLTDAVLVKTLPLFFFSLVVGPLISLPLGIPVVNVYILDLYVVFLCVVWIFKVKILFRILRQTSLIIPFSTFIFIGFLSLVFSPVKLTGGEWFISFLYLLRFLAYFSVYLTIHYLTRNKLIRTVSLIKGLGGVGLILALAGWLQYFLYDDLRNLYYLGWDPHYKRIFSLYLDPNYLGILLVLSLLTLFFTKGKKIILWILRVFLFVTLAFTYSRSSFLSLIGTSMAYTVFKKKYAAVFTAILVLIVTVLVLPRPGGEGVKLERMFSITERIQNWQWAGKIFATHPILGAGFNTVRYAKRQYSYLTDNLMESHSGAGFDNSFLFVAAATGIIGVAAYLWLLLQLFIKGNFLFRLSLVAVIVHSFFLNTLFYPFVIVWLWILAAFDITDYK